VTFVVELIVMIAVLLLLLVSYSFLADRFHAVNVDPSMPTIAWSCSCENKCYQSPYLVCGCYMLLNIIVVVLVNLYLVWQTLYLQIYTQVVGEIGVAFFKLFWARFVIPRLVTLMLQYLPAHAIDMLSLELFLALVNNIAVPAMVMAVIDASCFYHLFVPLPKVTSEYYSTVRFNRTDFVVVGRSSAVFYPPYTYGYQCTSTFSTYYVPTFIYFCLTATFASPLANVMLLELYKRAKDQPDSKWFQTLNFMLPQIWKPIEGPAKINVFRPCFDATQQLVMIMTCIGVLLTFGAAFPPLAAPLLFTILSTYFYSKVIVGRYLQSAMELGKTDHVDMINLECSGCTSPVLLRRCIWMIVTFSCLYYSLILFDALGSSEGANNSFWVFAMSGGLPLVMYGCFRLHQRFRNNTNPSNSAASTALAAEGIVLSPMINSEKDVELVVAR
jgi:hypothetical protein